MGSKFTAVCGFAAAADAVTPAAPKHYAQAASVSIDDSPIVYERESMLSADAYGAEAAGHQHTFSIEGMEVPVGHLGYLLWLALGAEATYVSSHLITPTHTQKFMCIEIDRTLEIGTSGQVTEILLGAKIQNLRFELTKKTFAKVSISGPFCDLGTPTTTLTATIPTGANEAPISWKTLLAANSGYFKLGYGGAAVASDTEIQRIAFEIAREIDTDAGVDLGSDQPTDLYEGKRTVTFEVDKQFSGNAKTARDAWLAQSSVELDMLSTVGSYSANILIAASEIVGGFVKEVGADAASTMATLSCRAHRNNGASPVISAEIVDAVSAIYS